MNPDLLFFLLGVCIALWGHINKLRFALYQNECTINELKESNRSLQNRLYLIDE